MAGHYNALIRPVSNYASVLLSGLIVIRKLKPWTGPEAPKTSS